MKKNETEHQWFAKQIASYLAGGLTPAERAEFESHASNCPDCAADLDSARELENHMIALFDQQMPSADFEDRLVIKLRKPKARRIHPLVRKVALSAAAVIVVGGLGYAGREFLISGKLASLHGIVSNLPVVRAPGTAAPKDGIVVATDGKVSIDFKDVPAGTVLDSFSKKLGYKVVSMVPTDAPITIVADADNSQGAVAKLNEALNDKGLAAVPQGQVLKIYASSEARHSSIPVISVTKPEDVERTDELVTAVIPLNHAKADEVRARLAPQVPAGADFTANTQSNALIITDSKAHIRDLAELASAADARSAPAGASGNVVKSGSGTLQLSSQGAIYGNLNHPGAAPAPSQRGTTITTNGTLSLGTPQGDLYYGTNPTGVTTLKGELSYTGKTIVNSGTLRSDARPTVNLGYVSGGTVTLDNRAAASSYYALNLPDSTVKASGGDVGGKTNWFDYYQPGAAAADADGDGIQDNLLLHALKKDGLAAAGELKSAQATPRYVATGAGTASLGPSVSKPFDASDAVLLPADVPLVLAQSTPANGQFPTTQPGASSVPVSIRRVIRDGTMEFEVDSFDTATATVSKIVAEEGGVVVAADSDRLDNNKVRGTITVRVPPDHLDTLVLKLRGLGDLKTQRLGSKDISREYTDLEGELRGARAMEERLLQMIKTAPGEVKDLLAAERELATWRTKIEKITGQMNFFDNQVAMATLSITAYEKDIRTPAVTTQQEEINTGLETDDVEKSRADAVKAIDDVKGRIIESTLQKLDAGQFTARIVAEVAPADSGPLVDRLRQLGRVVRLDIQKKQTDSGSPPSAGPRTLDNQPRVEQAPSRLIISMYNLANVAPRMTTNLSLAGEDVEGTYRAILKRIVDASGRVLVSNLDRQDATRMTGNIQFEVKADQADAVLNDIRGSAKVQVLALSARENPDTANVTSAKHAFTVQLVPASQLPPRETRSLTVQTSDVDAAVAHLAAAVTAGNGRMLDSNISQQSGGVTVARLAFDVPLDKLDSLIDSAKHEGTLRSAESSHDAQVPEGALSRGRVDLIFSTGETIVPPSGGFWQSIREGLSTSVKGLLWSLQLIVIGLCLIGPWVLLIWGGWKWSRRRSGTGNAPPPVL